MSAMQLYVLDKAMTLPNKKIHQENEGKSNILYQGDIHGGKYNDLIAVTWAG